MFGQDSEPVVLKRRCKAVVVPAGIEIEIDTGSLVYITQAMGGSFTVYFEGNLYRIAGVDADVLGKAPVTPPEVADGASDTDFEAVVWEQMRTCYDPEIPINIVDLGLIYGCDVERDAQGERSVNIRMTLTAPGCGMGDILVDDVREKVSVIPTVKAANVELVFDPPWSQDMMTEAAKLEAGLL